MALTRKKGKFSFVRVPHIVGGPHLFMYMYKNASSEKFAGTFSVTNLCCV